MHTTTALEHIETLFAAFTAGDTAMVIDDWHADARWHPVTPGGPWTEPKTRDEYFGEVLRTWYADRPNYTIPDVQPHEVGGLVVVGLTSNAGRGLMVYRVVEGKVAECWRSTPTAATRRTVSRSRQRGDASTTARSPFTRAQRRS